MEKIVLLEKTKFNQDFIDSELTEILLTEIKKSSSYKPSSLLVFTTSDKTKSFKIKIGPSDAIPIEIFYKNVQHERPLTHDLTKSIMDAVSLKLEKIVIDKLIVNDVFESKLVCRNENGSIVIDSRTSDAIALSLQFSCPIYIKNTVLEVALTKEVW